ncbi:hypothetical protein [Nocardia sp. XZ_19_231]|uniref:hypothetical protein n=1 Tax=Nocardia sp. XZ_19_231 TaxID=2769252 RepID=UPI001890A677|nr:hypothetical protein [Nocardia sp. XZ_19_231]
MRSRREHRRVDAAGIRDRAAEQEFEVGQREARAEEIAARSRAAQAEADAKAAHAEQLAQQAQVHHSDAAESRADLDAEWERADTIDPDSKPGQPKEDPERPPRST